MNKVTIAVENSTWNNVGDAFYQLSLQRIIKLAFPDANVVALDGPIERAFKLGSTRIRSEPFEADMHTNADHFVFSGPIVGGNFLRIYAPRIKAISEAGQSYSLVSIHCALEGNELEETRSFLRAHPPRALHTRDPSSLEKLKGLAAHARSGPCFAFFVRMLDAIPDIQTENPYLAISVYRSAEPKITMARDGALGEASIYWSDEPSQKYWRYIQHLEWMERFQTKQDLAGYDVVRPVQGHTPFPNKLFGKPNSYISYNPLCYLGVLKSCEAVISDRVHAGVTGLSFGRPVHIRPVDGRFDLFTGLPMENDGPFWRLSPDFISEAHDDALDWIRAINVSG